MGTAEGRPLGGGGVALADDVPGAGQPRGGRAARRLLGARAPVK